MFLRAYRYMQLCLYKFYTAIGNTTREAIAIYTLYKVLSRPHRLRILCKSCLLFLMLCGLDGCVRGLPADHITAFHALIFTYVIVMLYRSMYLLLIVKILVGVRRKTVREIWWTHIKLLGWVYGAAALCFQNINLFSWELDWRLYGGAFCCLTAVVGIQRIWVAYSIQLVVRITKKRYRKKSFRTVGRSL